MCCGTLVVPLFSQMGLETRARSGQGPSRAPGRVSSHRSPFVEGGTPIRQSLGSFNKQKWQVIYEYL